MATTLKPNDATSRRVFARKRAAVSAPADSLEDANRPRGNVALVQGPVESLRGKTDSLRRTRVGAAALVFTIIYAVLFLWNLSLLKADMTTVWVLMVSRFIFSAAIGCLLISPLPLKPKEVKILEWILFGGLTLLLCLSQYFVNLELLRHQNIPGAVAFVKNGVIQLFGMMVLYGTFIPNHPKTVARVVFSMAFLPIVCFLFLLQRAEIQQTFYLLRSVEQFGTNVLLLLYGASMASYGAFLLNGLREDLHEAQKFGQYQLLRKLGEGGMGEVYLAEHQLLKRPCALKLIKQDVNGDDLALARFEREVRASARLSHPNTIEIFDFGHTDDGTFYYVMEYLKGLSLGDLVKTAGPLPPGRTIYLFRQICAGLAEAHGLGLVHRDLKPANVFVAVRGGEADVAKVLDFGLVKLTKEPDAKNLTTEMTISGTPLFMSPEQAMGAHTLDARSDIYALGAVLYHALTGKPPFSGKNPFEILIAHTRDPVVPPSKIARGIPKDLETVVIKCLSKDPEDRYPDVKALSKALSHCEAASEWDAEAAESWWAERPELLA